jgi:glycosyl hydrolase family 25 family protein
VPSKNLVHLIFILELTPRPLRSLYKFKCFKREDKRGVDRFLGLLLLIIARCGNFAPYYSSKTMSHKRRSPIRKQILQSRRLRRRVRRKVGARLTWCRRYWWAVSATLLLALCAWIFIPNGLQRQLKGVALIEAEVCYRITSSEGDTLYIEGTIIDSIAPKVDVRPDSVYKKTTATGFFVSNAGHLVTTRRLQAHLPEKLPNETLQVRLQMLAKALKAEMSKQKILRRELDNYAHSHTVVDGGYNNVMTLRDSIIRRQVKTDLLLQLVLKMLPSKHLAAKRVENYRITTKQKAEKFIVTRHYKAHYTGDQTAHLILLQLDAERLPKEAHRFVIYRFNPQAWAFGQDAHYFLGYQLMTPEEASPALPDAAKTTQPNLPLAEGGPMLNSFGQVCGVVGFGKTNAGDELSKLFYSNHSYPSRVFDNWIKGVKLWFRQPRALATDSLRITQPLRSNVSGWQRIADHYVSRSLPDGRYTGSYLNGVRVGSGRMQYADGSVYAGQWLKDKREGLGVYIDKRGRIYTGQWKADTLYQGSCRTESDFYVGGIDKAFRRTGFGVFTNEQGDYYEGLWRKGKRNGFGIGLSLHHIVRAGIWRKGRFLGEQMVYNADRVYGIDISRHQHEQGKQRFAIDFSRLRITSLGTLPRKVKGKINYPVTFVYVKATEGATLYNKYYKGDLDGALRNGLHAGAYHFFSTYTPPAEQASFFLKQTHGMRGDLAPMLDVEPSHKQIERIGGRDVLFNRMLQWLRIVEQRTGRRPVLYVSQLFVNDYLSYAPESLLKYKMWIARYSEYKPYVHLEYWQLTPEGRVRGIHGEVDINVFNGSKAQFLQNMVHTP